MIAVGAAASLLQAQETRSIVVDERGDAMIERSFQCSALQWAQWKEQYGNHVDLLGRDLRSDFASAVIDGDPSVVQDDLHRQAVVKLKLRAFARYRGGGQFSIEVPKNMRFVTGSGTDWAFTSSSLANGEILNQTIRFKLPTKAQHPHFSIGGDYDQLSYTLKTVPSRPKAWLEMGIVLLILAAALGAISFRGAAQNATPPSSPHPHSLP
jgi:hypothetical protein